MSSNTQQGAWSDGGTGVPGSGGPGSHPQGAWLGHSPSNPSFTPCPSANIFPAGEEQTKGERRFERHSRLSSEPPDPRGQVLSVPTQKTGGEG